MKTLVRLPEGASTFLFQDTDDIYLFDTHVEINNPPTLVIADLNNQNVAVVENITPPEDWLGWKYLFDGTTWTPNPIWVEPVIVAPTSRPE